MNLRDLEYLMALADTRHFGEAAQRCQVTQPTLSTQIGKLERELEVEIFERGRRVELTTAGREIISQASVVLDEVDRLRQIARGSKDPLNGAFRLGVLYTAGPYLLPSILPPIRQEYPKLELLVREGTTEQLNDRLRLLDLEAAILSTPIGESALDSELIFREEFLLALPPQHDLRHKSRLRICDLADANILVLEEAHCMGRQVDDFCRAHLGDQWHKVPASSVESLRQMVSAGIGCALLPAMATLGPFAEISPVAVRRFADPAPSRDLVLVWRKHAAQRTALRELAIWLRQTIDWTALMGAIPAP